MNDSKFTNVPVSELTESDKAAFLSQHPNVQKKKMGKKEIGWLVALGVVVLGGSGVGLYFLLKDSKSPDYLEDELVVPIDLGVVEVNVDATMEASAEYVEELQNALENPELSFDERLSAEIDLANVETKAGKFAEAEARLNTVDRGSLTQRQLYVLYDAYVYLYKMSGNEAKRDEFAALLEKVTNEVWTEE